MGRPCEAARVAPALARAGVPIGRAGGLPPHQAPGRFQGTFKGRPRKRPIPCGGNSLGGERHGTVLGVGAGAPGHILNAHLRRLG